MCITHDSRKRWLCHACLINHDLWSIMRDKLNSRTKRAQMLGSLYITCFERALTAAYWSPLRWPYGSGLGGCCPWNPGSMPLVPSPSTYLSITDFRQAKLRSASNFDTNNILWSLRVVKAQIISIPLISPGLRCLTLPMSPIVLTWIRNLTLYGKHTVDVHAFCWCQMVSFGHG